VIAPGGDRIVGEAGGDLDEGDQAEVGADITEIATRDDAEDHLPVHEHPGIADLRVADPCRAERSHDGTKRGDVERPAGQRGGRAVGVGERAREERSSGVDLDGPAKCGARPVGGRRTGEDVDAPGPGEVRQAERGLGLGGG
jgi:hypothetical protein